MPDDETISKRNLSAQALIKLIDEADDNTLLIACASGTINGFESGFSQDSEAVVTIVKCIRDNQSAFPADLIDNALELRALAAIALGEIITRNYGSANGPGDAAILSSALITTGSELRPRAQERFLNIMMDELIASAHVATSIAAAINRQRIPLDFDELKEAASDTTAEDFLAEFRPVLENLFRHLEEQAASDREELQVLSWLYNNYSVTLGKSLGKLDPYETALCAGAEVGDLVRTPALDGIQNMVIEAVERITQKKKNKNLSLREIVKQWTDKGMSTLQPSDTNIQTIVRQFPPLFPLTWLCMRLLESGAHVGWEEEFNLKTGLDSAENYDPQTITKQVFNERVAQRIYAQAKQR